MLQWVPPRANVAIPHERSAGHVRASRAALLVLRKASRAGAPADRGPAISICDECVPLGIQIMLEDTAEPVAHNAVCSFCRKARTEVHVMFPGPDVYICDECVRLCSEILTESGGVGGTPQLPVARVRTTCWKRWIGRG